MLSAIEFSGSLFLGGLTTTITVITIFMRVLKIPGTNFIMFAVMLALLNVVT